MASHEKPLESPPHTPVAPVAEPLDTRLTGLKLYTLLACLTLVTFLSMIDVSIIGTAIPHITSQFHSLPDVGWYVGAYTLAAATLQPLSGKLYTYFPIKAIFLTFFFLFELGSLLCGVAVSSTMFILGRAVAGLGVSGLLNGALVTVGGSVGREKTPAYVGTLIGIGQLGVVMGPLVGGALTEHASWRWCFYLNLPVGGLAAVTLLFIHFPEATKKEPFSRNLLRKVIPKLDLIGFLLFVPPAVMLLLALQFGSGNKYPWKSATIIGLICGAVVLAIIFILWERRMGDRAMIPGSLLKQRIIWTSCIHTVCNISCLIVASNFLPTYFQAVKGDGPTMSGVHVLPSIGGQMTFVLMSGALISRLGYYLPWAFASGVIMAIGNGLVSTFSPTTSVAKWVVFQIIVGAGRGAGLQTSLIAVQNAVLPSQMSVGMAILIFFQNFGAAIAMVISNTIFAQSLTKLVPQYAPSVSHQAALEAGSGAGAVRKLATGHEDELSGVLLAYSKSFDRIFYFLVALSCVAVVASFGMGWVDVRKKKVENAPVIVVDEEKLEEEVLDEANKDDL